MGYKRLRFNQQKFLLLSSKHWLVIVACAMILLLNFCTDTDKSASTENQNTSVWLNHHDSVQYVGINTCKQCHIDIYNTFIETGMGKSFDHATKQKSAGDFSKNHTIYDRELNLYYSPFWKNDSLYVKEFRLEAKDTIHQRIEKMSYIVGSGQHTNSHMWMSNGNIYQAPFTFYTQEKIWDLPPGYENGASSRFQRLIGLECMSCHNAYPNFVKGSENKFTSVPSGIDCERCHGPGSLHVAEKQKGNIVDTSKYIDYTIVNPGKLSVDLQFDLCQRCHLQGNTVLKEGKSWYDFKPGQKLSETMLVFLPKYQGGEQDFIMASHADRLKQSKCFLESAKKADNNALRPYKNAMTCVTCHNPHVSVKAQGSEPFIKKCQSCHDGSATDKAVCSESPAKQAIEKNNCITCHMPLSGSIDIPHVTIHDHNIRKSPKMQTSDQKTFLGLFCINSNEVSPTERAKAYLNQFEKFDTQKKNLLDSALVYWNANTNKESKQAIETMVQLLHLKRDYQQLNEKSKQWTDDKLLNKWFIKTSLTNQDAWSCYRIGEALLQLNETERALKYFEKSSALAPYYPDFANKKGTCYLLLNRLGEAEKLFRRLSQENPEFAPAWNNLAFALMLQNKLNEAKSFLLKAIALDPNYEQAMLNLASIYLNNNEQLAAQKIAKQILKFNPQSEKAKSIL